MAGYSAVPPPKLLRSISASSDMAEECHIEGCTRRSLTGKGGAACCLECAQSNGANHASACDGIEESTQLKAQWREALHVSIAEKLTRFVARCTNPGCTRHACETEALCCQQCFETKGSQHCTDCEATVEQKVGDGKAFVDTADLGKVLQEVDSECWTKERLLEFFRLLDVQNDGKVRFAELCSWASCVGPVKDLTHATIGSGKQDIGHMIGVRIQGVEGGGGFSARIQADFPQGFLLNVSKTATVRELRDVLSLWLGLRSNTVILLTSESSALTCLDETLEANGVTLPGPMKRRNGEKLDMFLSTEPSDVKPSKEELIIHLDKEVWMKGQEERDRIAEYRSTLGCAYNEHEQASNRKDEDKEFDEFMCQRLGVSKEKYDELHADRKKMGDWLEKKYVAPDNYLVEVTDPEAIKVISDSLGRRVIRVYRNENQKLKERYENAKERLRNCGRPIKREKTQTQMRISGQPPLDHLGPYDASINEYPMWHGTGRQAVSGIAKTNFDIQRCGKNGLAWGTGFYFADDARTSVGYSAIGSHDRVNAKFPKCAYMLLNRVMCGNIKHFERSPNSHQEFDMWTADCIGSGGVWAGKDAAYECIRSPGTFCWVAVHSHQIYPAYVIVYEA